MKKRKKKKTKLVTRGILIKAYIALPRSRRCAKLPREKEIAISRDAAEIVIVSERYVGTSRRKEILFVLIYERTPANEISLANCDVLSRDNSQHVRSTCFRHNETNSRAAENRLKSNTRVATSCETVELYLRSINSASLRHACKRESFSASPPYLPKSNPNGFRMSFRWRLIRLRDE